MNSNTLFQTELVIDIDMRVADTQTMVADIHRNILTGQKDISDQNRSVGVTHPP